MYCGLYGCTYTIRCICISSKTLPRGLQPALLCCRVEICANKRRQIVVLPRRHIGI